MENGWIKLHRKLKQKGYYKKSQYIHLWVHLLLSANHKPKEFMWNREIIVIKEGQLLSGRKQLSEETDIPETTIENILKMLESEHQIKQQKTTKFRIITIVNWREHQKSDSKSDNRWTTDGQQMDTNKNDKKEKNDKNIADKSASHDFTDIIAYYHTLVLNSEGFKPEIRAKDCALVKSILKRYPKEQVKQIIYHYLSGEKASKLGIDLSIALSAHSINQYLSKN